MSFTRQTKPADFALGNCEFQKLEDATNASDEFDGTYPSYFIALIRPPIAVEIVILASRSQGPHPPDANFTLHRHQA